MGLFGFGKKSISNKEIDYRVMTHFQELGSPRNIGQKGHEDNFIKMLNNLDKWAESNDFGDWKRSAINGSIEAILRKTYQNCGVNDIVSDYLKKSHKIIMKM
jgi:hypothetical protein